MAKIIFVCVLSTIAYAFTWFYGAGEGPRRPKYVFCKHLHADSVELAEGIVDQVMGTLEELAGEVAERFFQDRSCCSRRAKGTSGFRIPYRSFAVQPLPLDLFSSRGQVRCLGESVRTEKQHEEQDDGRLVEGIPNG